MAAPTPPAKPMSAECVPPATQAPIQAEVSIFPSSEMSMTPLRSLKRPARAARMSGAASGSELSSQTNSSLSNRHHLSVAEGGSHDDEDAQDDLGDALGNPVDRKLSSAGGQGSESERGRKQAEGGTSRQQGDAERVEPDSGRDIGEESAFERKHLHHPGKTGDGAAGCHCHQNDSASVDAGKLGRDRVGPHRL